MSTYGTIHGGTPQPFQLDLGEPAEWVNVVVDRSAVMVRCARCSAWSGIYWSVIAKDKGAVRRHVDEHAACGEGE